jgi:hypothetical protein
MSRIAGVVMVTVLAVGCGGNTLKVGSDEDAGVASFPGVPDCSNAPNTVTVSEYPAPEACVTGNEQAALVGKWDGYYQGTGLSDEYATFHLNIMGANADKGLCGTIMFGTQTVPITIPPATDPTVNYPPAALNLGTNPINPSSLPTPAFLYTILNGRIDGQRVRFNYSIDEIFNSWCALQTSYARTEDCTDFGCLPNWPAQGSTDPSGSCFLIDPTNQMHQYSCVQMGGCSLNTICDCDKTHCVGRGNLGSASFDLVFNGDQATGAGAGGTTILNRVR